MMIPFFECYSLSDGVAPRAALIVKVACSSRLCRVNMDTPPERGKV